MDLPPEIANPPAIIYQMPEEQLRTRAPRNTPYFEHLCRDWGHSLKWIVYNSTIPGESKPHIEKLRGKQVVHLLNHLSLFETFQVPYNHYKLGLDETIKAERINMEGIPHFGRLISGCLVLPIPLSMDMKEGRPYIRKVHKALDKGIGFTLWAEGTRSRDEELKDFQEGTLRIIYQHAINKDIDLTISPQAEVYDKVIEKPFFGFTDFFKNYIHTKGGRWCYERADLVPFAARFLRNRIYSPTGGIMVHSFGEPFSIHECKNEVDLTERARASIIEQKTKYQTWVNIGGKNAWT